VALVVVVLAALFAGTSVLNRWYRAQRQARAAAHRQAADGHTAQRRLELGVGEYRAALSLERDDLESERALALVLLELGRLSESESYLTDLLRRDPVSGPLNLGLARIRSQRGMHDEARQLYQRAIYGEWTNGPEHGRLTARFELAEYLQAHGTRDELLAELLRLKAERPQDDGRTARRLGDLLLQAAAPEHAIDVFRSAVDATPEDVGLLAALADAQVRSGRSAEARRTLRRALAIDSGRVDLRERLLVVDRAFTLDPTLPNLRLTTRARRARQLLAEVVVLTSACDGTPAAARERRTAQQHLQRRALTMEVAEDHLAAAAALWSAAAPCRASGPQAQSVSQVIDRVRATAEDPQP
jgi:tetratricopeptide (TPR) repeat protein